ncbi:peptidase C13 family-domain-containing protein [Immersiella caudata]|uniref:Peptidase C13 family-domain-containing protein n=1 Tax=Immersiella caudata TaxID=314043 RepID=A0AA39X5G7_9PEZI|nr:peptidase C13 family-domain-containing protein [Immersiella caudata]
MKLSSVLRLPALLAATLLAPAALVEAEHTSNWAVLVCTSRFWFNYRHLANVLSIYRTVKRLGIPDSQIILMLPDDMACNPRNAFPGTVYSNADRAVDLYGDNIEVDYRGYEVTVENFIRLLTDRVGDEMPRSKRLLTDDRSNILVYMTGHGGNEFLKFQDAEEIGAFDLADAFEQMWEKKRYHEILFMIDTCQANTMFSKLYSPNIIATGSSKLDQSSYSHHADNDVGVAVIDRYTYYNLEFLESEVRDTSSKKTVGELFDSYTYEKIHSHAGVRYDLFPGGAEAARSRLITDFFGNVQNVEVDSAKNTNFEEDLLSLSRTIAALRQKADKEEAAQKNANANATVPASRPVQHKKMQFAKPLTDENWWTKKIYGATALAGIPKPKQKFLPLREITLTSRPLVKRALAFSCDGDLAVAADDSVHVLIPEFPDLPARLEEKKRKTAAAAQHQGVSNGKGKGVDTNGGYSSVYGGADGEEDEDDSSEIDEENGFENYRRSTRAQYSEGSKHMPVSYPPLDPRINRELFVAAGEVFPYDGVGEGEGMEVGGDGEEEEEGGYDSEGAEDGEGTAEGGTGSNRPFGAGYGPITGVGSSMNHVVHMAWSPSGLGVNRRPVLGILTSSGVVAMYGDGGTLDNILPRANEGMLQRRELESWVVLWGVGERLLVPGQQAEISENVQGVAWAREIGPGQALLATVNDVKEVAILSVQTVPSETGGGLVWKVREMTRFTADGPHPKVDVTDVDWTPCGTSFGLNFSPWVETMESRTCFLSFVDRNYIGFRKISIIGDWLRGETPDIRVDETDSYGRCVHLSTDAFVEFENVACKLFNMSRPLANVFKLWDQNGSKICRGIIATPFHLVPFDFSVSPVAPFNLPPHTTTECGTTYTDDSVTPSENPISDLVIHPPNKSDPGTMPIYTLVRLSATATNNDWFETNPSPPADSTVTVPQWARDIGQKLEIAVPADMHLKRGYGEDSDSEDDSASTTSDASSAYDSDSNSVVVPQGPEIHPHRFRIYGLAISPGGGTTAVLTSQHSTQHPERGGWHTVKSSVFFGYKPRRRFRDPPKPLDTHTTNLTVEARLFEYLYGGGPPVHGINAVVTADEQYLLSHQQQQERSRLEELFRPALERQTCDLCGAKMKPPKQAEGRRLGLSRCEKGHFFGTCATSGLAVQMPGITRSCGTCGLRTMRAAVLAGKMEEKKADVLREVGDGVCGGCGGKFLN